MKKIAALILAVAMMLSLTVTATAAEATPLSENWKVAVLYPSTGSTEECYTIFLEMQAKYGEDHIIGVCRPQEQEGIVSTFLQLVSDPDVFGLVDLQEMAGGTAAVEACREIRPDVFYGCCLIGEDPSVTTTQYDISLDPYKTEPMAEAIVKVAKEMGATTLVHYSFPRHMGIAALYARRVAMEKYCEEYGLKFVFENTPDPLGDSGAAGTQQFLLEDVPKKVAEYGKDTAFFGTNPTQMEPMIKAAIESGAIIPSTNDPSPFLGFIPALGIEIPADKTNDVPYAMQATKEALAERGMTGRCATWEVPSTNLYGNSLVDYAVKYAKGELAETRDLAAMLEIMKDEAQDMTGKTGDELGITLAPMMLDGVEYDYYFGFMMNYTIY